MERLFSPCTRTREIFERLGRLGRLGGRIHNLALVQELNLDVSTEDLLSAERAFTYADLYTMLGNHAVFRNRETVAWLTPHAVAVRANGIALLYPFYMRDYYRCSITVDGKAIYALASSLGALSEIGNVFRRLLLADVSEVYELEVRIQGRFMEELYFIVPGLAYLIERCQSLKVLILQQISLDEDHVRVIGDISKPGLEIELQHCQIAGAAAAALAQVLGRNQGPTKLECCETVNSVLADGLRGNSRLKSLRPRLSRSHEDGNQEILALAGALKENKGLVDLDFMDDFRGMSDETWYTVCDSLKTHPTLEVLDIGLESRVPLAPAVIKSRIQALVNMLKVNMSIHTIPLVERYSEHEPFRGSVIPYLETNRLRPRVVAIQKTCPVSYRAKVLGRALLAARTDVNSFWMLLSGNAEVAFSSTTATITPASSATRAWCFCC